MKKLMLLTAVVLAGFASWGVSSVLAGGGVNTGGGTSSPSVAGTTAGMPVTAQSLFAVVNGDGTLARSFPASVKTIHIGTGTYEVSFTGRNQTHCSWTATIGNAGTGTSANGFIQVDLRAGNNNGVFVETTDTTGAAADRPFHLHAMC